LEENTKYTKAGLFIFVLGLLITACATQKKAQYDMPPGLQEKNQKQFVQFFTEGEAYYAVSCAECHNKKVNNKVVLPQFTSEQLELYIVRVKNPEHTKRLTTKDVTDEELQKIMFFLRYKKK